MASWSAQQQSRFLVLHKDKHTDSGRVCEVHCPICVPNPYSDYPARAEALISKIVNQILAAKHTNPDTDVSELEKKINQIVYLLYDLTPEEIDIVEGAATV